MFYGIEHNTDLRCLDTKVKKFRSKKSAMDWKSGGGGLAFPGAATNDIPVSQQNWHHRIRKVYEMPTGWRPPSKKILSKMALIDSTPTYMRYSIDAMASVIRASGEVVMGVVSAGSSDGTVLGMPTIEDNTEKCL